MYENSIEFYYDKLRDLQVCTHEEHVELMKRIENGDHEAWQQMLQANLRLVISIAKGYVNRGVDLDDLVQEGILGLEHAIRNYDWRFGFTFSTYATNWICQYVGRAILNQVATIRIPIGIAQENTRNKKIFDSMKEELGREPTDEEFEAAVETKPDRLYEFKFLPWSVSLDEPRGPGELGVEGTLGHTIPEYKYARQDDVAGRNSIMRHVAQAEYLTPRERQIMLMRLEETDVPLARFAEKIGLTRERVRQIYEKARVKVQRHLIKDRAYLLYKEKKE
ncbi:RNA polymerase sigma factor RpoD/SigA [Patescibacteria group bacterium]